ncbi:MAG: orotidine-5'-phosphate decarboxylase [Alphaproteobacteria bacterium]|nr:orotidine-5'-phosphate decarboxylase [Alphaproteobacteria bacterium]
MSSNPVFVAIDTTDLEYARALAARLKPHVGGIKLGLEFFSAHGPAGVRAFAEIGLPIFLDLKFHDIPNTVAGAVRAAAGLGVDILNVHAAGGPAMLKAAVEAARGVNPDVKVIAVTVLTSLADADLEAVGQQGPAADQVMRLATLTRDNGLHGVVCSAHEIARLRAALGPDFLLVVPGIRPKGADLGDQQRVMGPKEALDAGASILVIGRPITAAPNPVEAARAIAESLGFS